MTCRKPDIATSVEGRLHAQTSSEPCKTMCRKPDIATPGEEEQAQTELTTKTTSRFMLAPCTSRCPSTLPAPGTRLLEA